MTEVPHYEQSITFYRGNVENVFDVTLTGKKEVFNDRRKEFFDAILFDYEQKKYQYRKI